MLKLSTHRSRIDNIPIKPSGATKARFDGYFEVPKAGDYRFILSLGKKDSEAEFTLHHLPVPLLTGKATKDGDEISEFVELKPGVLYRFSVNVRDLRAGDVSILVQSEGIFKNDGLSQLALFPQTSVDRVVRTYVLLTKIDLIIKQLTLSEREVRHILTHRSDFENIDLSKIPTIEKDTSAASPVVLFKQILLLTDYARLKRELSAGTDDLIAVLENASRSLC